VLHDWQPAEAGKEKYALDRHLRLALDLVVVLLYCPNGKKKFKPKINCQDGWKHSTGTRQYLPDFLFKFLPQLRVTIKHTRP
jgi:hypothetical protein